ncbi:MAG: tyrosine-protein phosphatase [Chlamydiota bacterium]|nr:tyrosine-protein phosphatase [Chlamydiota bacterium]
MQFEEALEFLSKYKLDNSNPTIEFRQIERLSQCFAINKDGRGIHSNLFDSKEAIRHLKHNRYKNILAYDRNFFDVDGYFNGSKIFLHPTKEAQYIATQAPLPETRDQHWKMLWESGCSTTAMLTKIVEGERVKAHTYLPKLNTEAIFGNLIVTCTDEKIVGRSFTEKTLIMTFENETRPLTHFHFEGWPDFGVLSATELLMVINTIRKACKQNTPLVVHCSAGIGRTGTFTAAHSIIEDLEAGACEKNISIAERVFFLRSQRNGLVENAKQYNLIYEVVKAHLKSRSDKRV